MHIKLFRYKDIGLIFLHLSIAILCLSYSNIQALEKAYVTNTNGTVTVIDTATDTILTTINVTDTIYLYGAVAHPNGTKVYVVGTPQFGNLGNVYVIDTTTDIVTDTISVVTSSGFPRNLAITPDGSQVYVSAAQGYRVYVIDTATNNVNTALNTPISTGGTQSGIAIGSVSGVTKAYVGNGNGANSFFVIPTSTNTPTTISNQTTGNIQSVAITPDGSKVYFGSGNNQKKIYAVNTVTNIQAAAITLSADPSSVSGIAMTPSGTSTANRAYVVNSTNVSIINTLTDTVFVSPIALGATGVGVAITSDGLKAYVANGARVSVISTTNNTVSGTPISISGTPQAIAIALIQPPSPPPLPSPPPSPPPSPSLRLVEGLNQYAPLQVQSGLRRDP